MTDITPPAVSYAEVASKGPKQSPEEAAAPQPPQVAPTTAPSTSTASTHSSLIDVDTPSVRTVPSDFASQDVQTETQAARLEREEALEAEAEAEARERAEADLAAKKKKQQHQHKKKTAGHAKAAKGGEVRRAEGWLARYFGLDFEGVGGGGGGGGEGVEGERAVVRAVAAANLLAVVGLSGWLGYRAWGLYDRGRLGWREAGIGLGVVGVVGVVEGVLANYFFKPKDKEE